MKANLEKLKLEIYGESHGEKIGVLFGGLEGKIVHKYYIDSVLNRRKSGQNVWSTPRKEDDVVKFVSGIEESNGLIFINSTINAEIENKNIKSKDYNNINLKPRPSHADYVAYIKDGYIASGGGRFSGRMTAPLCIAGAIAKEILEQYGIYVGAYISKINNIDCGSYKNQKSFCNFEKKIKNAQKSDFPILDDSKRKNIEKLIETTAFNNDSVGGKIECVVFGAKAGQIGDALFEGLESKISYMVYSIPAVKGVEFGDGFDLISMLGSEANDQFKIENGNIFTITNRSGGINGGISNGMPIALSVAIRPTPSISKKQKTIELNSMKNTEIEIKGRHDTCIVPRAVVCVECAVAIAILDDILKGNEND